MPMNPLSPTMSTMGMGGSPVPGVNNRPYPTLGPAQGGVGPGATASPQQDPNQQQEQDKLATVVRLAMATGINDPNGLGNFLKGLGFQTASRLARPAQPRGITADVEQGQTPPSMQGRAPMPPNASATPMPPSM